MINTIKFRMSWLHFTVALFIFFTADTVMANTDHHTQSISVKEVVHAQEEWANGLIAIGKAYTNHGNYQIIASNLVNQLYAYNYGKGKVLFKPTKAQKNPFRTTYASALSYFIGGDSNFKEDAGFALVPWTKIFFNNDQIYVDNNIAIAMGQYTFTDIHGKNTLVDYTFGYKKTKSGDLKIILHHSSLPYSH